MVSYLKSLSRRLRWKRRARRAAQRRKKLDVFGPRVRGLLAETDQGWFVVDPEDTHVARTLLDTGRYGTEEIELARSLLSPGGNALIVGAHIGALAVPLSRDCRRLFAIEANPRTFRYLTANLLLNECANTTALNLAASDRKGTLEFLLSRANSGGSKRVPREMDIIYTFDDPERVTIEADALDAVIAERHFDLVVMDIEGSEYFALTGMPEILAGARALIVEFLPYHLRQVAGIDADAFAKPLLAQFSWLYVPKDGRLIEKARILETLRGMYRDNECHDGLLFTKDMPPPRRSGVSKPR
jgi:FkbM family methyltransferase